jgi:hypothetical protein
VRLAITARARSERRIAVRGRGVGVDASSAFAKKLDARAPSLSASGQHPFGLAVIRR